MAYPFCISKWLIRFGLARLWPSVQRRTDGAGAFLHHYSDRVLASPYAQVRESLGIREPAGHDVIDLGLGAPLFDLMPSATTKLPADRRGPPPVWGDPDLLEAVAHKLHDDHALSFQPGEEVLITAGVSGALDLVLDSFVNPGDRAVLLDPSSFLYSFALQQRRARIRWVPTWQEQGQTRLHLEPMVQALRGAKLIILNAPANPTGGVFTAEDLEAIAWWAHRHDVLIFCDQAGERFQYEGERTCIASLPKAQGRAWIAGSVSQGHALVSARVGWLAGQRHLVRPCALTAAIRNTGVPTLSQQLTLTALRQGDSGFQPIRDQFDGRRRYVYDRLIGMGLRPDWPAGGFFLWAPVGIFGVSGQEFAERLFRAKKVVVWPGDYFGPNGSQHIRLSFAGEEGRLREGLLRLSEFVRDLRLRLEAAQYELTQRRRAA